MFKTVFPPLRIEVGVKSVQEADIIGWPLVPVVFRKLKQVFVEGEILLTVVKVH